MALRVPRDIPRSPFIRAGLISLDGDMFEGKKRVGTKALYHEIEYVRRNLAPGHVRTKGEWEQVRNVVLLWCFSDRTQADLEAIDALLCYVGINDNNTKLLSSEIILGAIERKHSQAPAQPASLVDWTALRPPPQRLPSTNNVSPTPRRTEQPTFTALYPLNNSDTHPPPSSSPSTPNPTSPMTISTLNSNPKFQGRYTFTEHKQEYEGYQFQCIFRCLKDGKHCRKAPVREMNRHLRDRHHFRSGFKIAGVDWDRKRWRGAGAGHEECIGRLVEKDSPDGGPDGADNAEEEQDSGGEYVVR